MKLRLAALLIAATPNAWAIEHSLFDLSLEDLLNVRITTSTLQEETLLEVPSSVTIFERDELNTLGISTIAELLNFVPGYQSYRGDNGNDSYFVSSRARRRGPNSKGILFLINGSRYNTNQHGSAFSGQNFPLDNVKRVEVIRGPGSAIYGSNAFMGVINIVTETDNSVSFSTGNDRDGRIALQSNFNSDDYALETFLWARRRSGDQLTAYDAETDSLISAEDSFESKGAHLLYRNGPWTNQSYFIREVDIAGYLIGLPAKSPEDRFTSDKFFTEIKYADQINQHWHLDHAVAYAQVHELVEVTSSTSLPLSLVADGEHNELVVSSNATYSGHSKHEWLFGFEYRHYETQKAELTRTGAFNDKAEVQNRSPQDIFGVFVQNQHRLTDKLRSTAGFRYDHYSDIGAQLSPRLGLTYAVDEFNSLKLLYGEAYRAPVRTETDQVDTPQFVSNPNLEPEISKTTELIWAHMMESGFVQTSLFFTEIVDSINTTSGSPQTLINSGYEASSGIENEWVYSLNEQWHLRSALTCFFERPNGHKSSESEVLIAASLSYEAEHYSVNFKFNHQSEKADINASPEGYTKLDDLTVFGIHVSYQPKPNIEVFASLDNVFDENYRTPGTLNTNTYGIEGYSRQFETGIKLLF